MAKSSRRKRSRPEGEWSVWVTIGAAMAAVAYLGWCFAAAAVEVPLPDGRIRSLRTAGRNYIFAFLWNGLVQFQNPGEVIAHTMRTTWWLFPLFGLFELGFIWLGFTMQRLEREHEAVRRRM